MVFCFTAENIWIDPWLRNKSHRMLSLVPEAQSGTWFLVFTIGGIALALLVFCEILLMRDRGLSVRTKVATGIAVLVVLLLSVEWVRVTNGMPGVLRLETLRRKHTVTLTWKASASKVTGYNVYRGETGRSNYVRINHSLVSELTYTDSSVDGGVTYSYVIRAVDDRGNESADSNETSATIPSLW
jgi:hypothetical protein